jgi:hypothetical protein
MLAWLNLPNFLTIMRIVMIPFFLYYLLSQHPRDRFFALMIFGIASITDFSTATWPANGSRNHRSGVFSTPSRTRCL